MGTADASAELPLRKFTFSAVSDKSTGRRIVLSCRTNKVTAALTLSLICCCYSQRFRGHQTLRALSVSETLFFICVPCSFVYGPGTTNNIVSHKYLKLLSTFHPKFRTIDVQLRGIVNFFLWRVERKIPESLSSFSVLTLRRRPHSQHGGRIHFKSRKSGER